MCRPRGCWKESPHSVLLLVLSTNINPPLCSPMTTAPCLCINISFCKSSHCALHHTVRQLNRQTERSNLTGVASLSGLEQKITITWRNKESKWTAGLQGTAGEIWECCKPNGFIPKYNWSGFKGLPQQCLRWQCSLITSSHHVPSSAPLTSRHS